MKWREVGIVKTPSRLYPWLVSHCQLPTPMPLSEKVVRVFFAARNEAQRSHVGYVDLGVGDGAGSIDVISWCEKPVLEPGPLGCFDEHGVYPSCVVEHEGIWYMFFIGWNQGVEAPMFYASIGIAVSHDGVSFQRISPAPILSRSAFDPCLVTSPHVYRDGDLWRMSYVSGTSWTRNALGQLQSHYHIKLAESRNLIDWSRTGQVAIDYNPGETNIARPCIVKLGPADYRMWYSFVNIQNGKYRIGYAVSRDGINWQRNDSQSGIDVGVGLAGEMICYPSVFKMGDRYFMLFNGDDYGRDGFGISILDDVSFR